MHREEIHTAAVSDWFARRPRSHVSMAQRSIQKMP